MPLMTKIVIKIAKIDMSIVEIKKMLYSIKSFI